MLSVIIPVRNTRNMAANCLTSLIAAVDALQMRQACEFILMDDNSEANQAIPDLFRDFRNRVTPGAEKVTLLRFRKRTHYTGACALGFSLARGSHVLLLSHDMIVTPDYLRTLLAVAALDESFGLVRGTSNYVDCFPQYTVLPPVTIRSLDDVASFSRYMATSLGLRFDPHPLLTGDAVLVRRAVLEKIGTFDTRFFGYFGDIDFGLRAQRAGFKMVCAVGAWLFHEGAGHYKDQAATTMTNTDVVHANRMQVVNNAYKEFRSKWDKSLPQDYPGTDRISMQKMLAVQSVEGGEYSAPVTLDPAAAELL